MSNPADPTSPQPNEQPTEAYPPADAQPTEATRPPTQPTAAYPPADEQPTAAYPPAASGTPSYAPPSYGQPPTAPPAYGEPPTGAQPGDTATRPKTMGWMALGLAIGGLVLVGAAYIPLMWGSLILALIGGLLLLAALVLGIVTLVSKKQGGNGLGIGAIIVSVIGGGVWLGAITLALVFIGLAAVEDEGSFSSPAPSASAQEVQPTEEGTIPDDDVTGDEGTEGDAPVSGTYDEAAFLAEVRPAILTIMQELDPSITEEAIDEVYSDDMLIATGQALLSAGDEARDSFIASTVEGSGGLFSEDQAARFYDTLVNAADRHLAE